MAAHCQGEIEHRLGNGTRVDCLTETHAIEYDWGASWYEAIGQSLYYGMETGKRSGVVLISRTHRGDIYWQRLNDTIRHYRLPIDTWRIRLPNP
uniref:Uncharacterized protein n=1 Tax=Candidatus Kentrum sp. LFY TaxID=2126342 RepID=A0A450WI20_9GAMM|nr:MAG: hypothetical protein BECKLFY1418C_GA0070996_102519 [Candidatus Kentron sp. LFY]